MGRGQGSHRRRVSDRKSKTSPSERNTRLTATSNGCVRSQTPRVARPGRPPDDLGYLPQARESEVLFTLIAERYERRSLGITSNLVYSEWERLRQPHGHRRSHRPGVHRTIILEFDVPSYHTDAGQQRGQEQKMNPRVRSIGIRPPPIPPEGRGPSRTAALPPPCGGIHPPDGVLPP